MKAVRALNAFGRTIVSALRRRKWCGGSAACIAGRKIALSPGKSGIRTDHRECAPCPPPAVVDRLLNPFFSSITACAILAYRLAGARHVFDFTRYRMQAIHGQLRNAVTDDDHKQLHARPTTSASPKFTKFRHFYVLG
jgi:hypothetical protein